MSKPPIPPSILTAKSVINSSPEFFGLTPEFSILVLRPVDIILSKITYAFVLSFVRAPF